MVSQIFLLLDDKDWNVPHDIRTAGLRFPGSLRDRLLSLPLDGIRRFALPDLLGAPGILDAILCRKIILSSLANEDPSNAPFCRTFRQFQVIEVRGAWARIGADVWIETAVLTNPAPPHRLDPHVAGMPDPRSIRRTASW